MSQQGQQQHSSAAGAAYARTGRGGAGNYHWYSDPAPRPDDIEALDLKQSSVSERRRAAARLEQLQTAEALQSSQRSSLYQPYSRSGRGGVGNYHYHEQPPSKGNGGNEQAPGTRDVAPGDSEHALPAVRSEGPRTFGRGGAGNIAAVRDANEQLDRDRRQNDVASLERTRREIELQVLRTLQTPPGALLGHSQRSNRLLDAV